MHSEIKEKYCAPIVFFRFIDQKAEIFKNVITKAHLGMQHWIYQNLIKMYKFERLNVRTRCLVLWSNFRDHIPCGGGHRGCLPQYQARSALQPPGQPDGRGCLSVTASGIWRANWFEAGPIDRSRGPQSPTTNWTALEACNGTIKKSYFLPARADKQD